MKKLVIIISWLLVLCWMGLIYYLSDMNGVTSTYKSEQTINIALTKALNTSYKIGLTDKEPDVKRIKKISNILDLPLRKIMHASVYFVLTLLLINALLRSNVKGKKIFYIALLISFLYACSDEFHQSFLSRTASFNDVLIDTFGSFLAIYIVLFFLKIRTKKRKN